MSIPLGIVDIEVALIWAYREQGVARKLGPWHGESWEFVAAALGARHAIPSGWVSIARLASLGVRIDSGGGPALIATPDDDGPHGDALIIHLAVCQYAKRDHKAALEIMDHAAAGTAPGWLLDLRVLAEDRDGLVFCPAHSIGRKVYCEQGKDGQFCPISYTGTDEQRDMARLRWRRSRALSSTLARRRRGPRGSF